MIRTRNVRRNGFTLVELLVGISIFLTLAGVVLLLYPGARDQDRVRYTVSDITAHLRMAQSMAARDKAPRGIRFLYNSDPTNEFKTDPRWVTELQYIEQPAPLIPKRNPLSTANVEAEPRVRFNYELSDGSTADRFGRPAQPAGTVVYRQCVIENLTSEQAGLIQKGCTIVMPALDFWAKVSSVPATQSMPKPPTTPPANPNAVTRGSPAVSGVDLEVTLETYPDAMMGGSTQNHTHQFAIYLNAVPLVGEPLVLLPRNVCVDLHAQDTTDPTSANWKKVGSIGPPPNTTSDFDVLFTPDGKLLAGSSSQVFLHVRDFTKTPTMQLTDGPALLDAFQKGGEQFFITVRTSGAIAFNNVAWPNASGQYTGAGFGIADPFVLARDQGR